MKNTRKEKQQQASLAPGQKQPARPQQKAPPPGFFNTRSLLLSFLFLLSLVLIRQIKSYANFFEKHIEGNYADIRTIQNIPDYDEPEMRKEIRWARPYKIVLQFAQSLKQDPNAIVMIPPSQYIRAIDPNLQVPEPAVTYYYCGLKTAWGTTDYVYKSTYAYVVTKDRVGVMPIHGKAEIDSLLRIYQNYPYSL